MKNVLVNHYSNSWSLPGRSELRRDGLLSYAVIDFDISVAFRRDAERSVCRLPSAMSYDGTPPQPDDTTEEDVDYDPFAFDVGCMGITFCDMIQVRLLAPDICKRLRAVCRRTQAPFHSLRLSSTR